MAAGGRLAALVCVLALTSVTAGCRAGGAAPGQAGGKETMTRTIDVDGVSRRYSLHLPTTRPAGRLPLVLAFHGRLGTGADMERLSGLSDLADRDGFVVAYPDGLQRAWNGGQGLTPSGAPPADDVAFSDRLVGALRAELPVDADRVYAVGMSNGGIFVNRLACERPAVFAAVATVAASASVDVAARCAPSGGPGVLALHGTADTFVPYSGGPTAGGGQVLPAPENARAWARRDSCDTGPHVQTLVPEVTETRWGGCAGGASVVLVTLEGGGHTWPGSDADLPPALVGPTLPFAASPYIVSFLSSQRRSG